MNYLYYIAVLAMFNDIFQVVLVMLINTFGRRFQFLFGLSSFVWYLNNRMVQWMIIMDECIDKINSKPEAPSDTDCCNSGCNPCVFDLYERRLAEWKKGNKINEPSSNIRYDLLCETKFKPFVILKKFKVNHNVFYFQFQPILENSTKEIVNVAEQNIPGILPYRPGQHLVIKSSEKSQVSLEKEPLEQNCGGNKFFNSYCSSAGVFIKHNDSEKVNNTESKFITRAYTPISLSSEEINCCCNVLIKLYENGRMSNYFRNMNVGDTLYIRGPNGDFHYTSNSHKYILFVCIGTGIAPVFAVAKEILNNENDETIIYLLYGSRKIDDILLRDELRGMTSFWNFSAEFYISTRDDNFVAKFGEHFVFGKIDESAVLKKLDIFKNGSCLVLICGTTEFSDKILNIVLKYGVKKESIYVF